jgi:hypothetical protein
MELIAILIVMYAVKALFTDAAYAVRGETPPRVKVRMAKLKAAGTADGRPRRYGAGDYFRDLWHDAMEDARESRVAKRADAKQAKADAAGDATPDEPGPSTVAPTPPIPQFPQFGAGQQNTEQADDEALQVPAWLPPFTAGIYRDHLAKLDPDGMDAWRDWMRGMSAEDRRDYWRRIAADVPGNVHDEITEQFPLPIRDSGAGQPDGLADVRPIRPTNQEDTVSAPTTTAASAGAPEATGLTSATAYARGMADAHASNAASTEQWIASLEGNGGVSGPAVAAARQACEKQQEAAAAWAACADALSGHTSVREAYQANQGAGTREFVTSD